MVTFQPEWLKMTLRMLFGCLKKHIDIKHLLWYCLVLILSLRIQLDHIHVEWNEESADAYVRGSIPKRIFFSVLLFIRSSQSSNGYNHYHLSEKNFWADWKTGRYYLAQSCNQSRLLQRFGVCQVLMLSSVKILSENNFNHSFAWHAQALLSQRKTLKVTYPAKRSSFVVSFSGVTI